MYNKESMDKYRKTHRKQYNEMCKNNMRKGRYLSPEYYSLKSAEESRNRTKEQKERNKENVRNSNIEQQEYAIKFTHLHKDYFDSIIRDNSNLIQQTLEQHKDLNNSTLDSILRKVITQILEPVIFNMENTFQYKYQREKVFTKGLVEKIIKVYTIELQGGKYVIEK